MDNDKEYATELIEINLMLTQMDLSLGKNEQGANARALHPLKEALRQIRAEMTGPPTDKARANASAPSPTAGRPAV